MINLYICFVLQLEKEIKELELAKKDIQSKIDALKKQLEEHKSSRFIQTDIFNFKNYE